MVWLATIGLGLVLILLVVLILQNTQQVKVSFLWWEGTPPLAAALLIAAAGGILVTAIAGSLRILQLRRRVKRAMSKTKAVAKHGKRVGLEILGWVLIVAGIAGLILPGPGLLGIFAGMVILSQQYEWAERRVDPVKKKALGGASDAVQTWPRIAVRDVLRPRHHRVRGLLVRPAAGTLVVADRRAVVALRRVAARDHPGAVGDVRDRADHLQLPPLPRGALRGGRGLMAGRPVAVVIAAGPGVSGSLARRFAREGYDLALVGRETEVLHALAGELEARGATVRYAVADVTDAPALTAAVTGMADELGRVDWLHFNPSAFRQKTPVDLTAEELLTDVGLGVGALLTALHAVRPYLRAGARVTATGSMAADKPWNEAASLGVQKAGLRNLIRSIDTTLEPDGVRAVSLTVRGTLGTDGPFTPDRVADAIWDAGHQDESDWQTEVPYTG